MARWWEQAPRRVCARCGGETYSQAAVPLHRRCRVRAAARGSTTWSERKRRAAAVQRHREQFGELCPGWRRPPHPVEPPNRLTADHVRSVASGGAEDGPLQILCNVCNAGKREASGLAHGHLEAGGVPHYPGPSRAW